MFTHEDHRRSLMEFAPGTFTAAKALIAKTDCVVGDHHHAKKSERFILVAGFASEVVIGDSVITDVAAPAEFDVPAGTYHRFSLRAGSILFGIADKPFDPADELKGQP